MSIAMHIVDAVVERADGARIKRVRVEVGALSGVLPDALRFAFDLACRDTVAAGAALEIVEARGEARCRTCNGTVHLDRPFGRCPCGGIDLEWTSGDQLLIRDMEIEAPCV